MTYKSLTTKNAQFKLKGEDHKLEITDNDREYAATQFFFALRKIRGQNCTPKLKDPFDTNSFF